MDSSGVTASETIRIAVNGRFRVHRLTGMERYAYEITSRLKGKLREMRPEKALKGLRDICGSNATCQLLRPARFYGARTTRARSSHAAKFAQSTTSFQSIILSGSANRLRRGKIGRAHV